MLPSHLKRYIVSQDYGRYTPVDQAVWRYIMRQLVSFLSVNAHECYREGLKKSGISIDRIPQIDEMGNKLSEFGWVTVPVSGFIPPAAFMEIQAFGYLPVAADLRTVDHIMYTPAPDIVHEAAGHAPILVDPEYAAYLKSYAQVAAKAIISHHDMAQYEAIRALSDLKEDPSSTTEQIKNAEDALTLVNDSITDISEAALLGRMNWWTAEYGLIGTLEQPRIYGAGLLSSIGEARSCLGPSVVKLPLTVDCINYTYDITEKQPQLFVTPDFAHLRVVLDELADRMAFRRGGVEGLEKARKAQTVNSVELESGLQISGKLKSYEANGQTVAYVQFEGPSQLSIGGKEIKGHGIQYHADGYGSPLGQLEGFAKPLTQMSDEDLVKISFKPGSKKQIRFTSGVVVEGKIEELIRHPETGALILVGWKDCRVSLGDRVLFDPSWGTFDMAVGSHVTSVFGGPADRRAYGETDDFVAKVIPRKPFTPIMQYKHELYQAVRTFREKMEAWPASTSVTQKAVASEQLEQIYSKLEAEFPHDWLLRLEILELAQQLPSDSWRPRVELDLRNMSEKDAQVAEHIADGVKVFGQRF
ncbi:MAG: aromatic amino acid hydroxylase [Proteobacteria bacterium]|nr:MAG: aromatic amino acid hydroxylase [Pseudomonadota bacterium]